MVAAAEAAAAVEVVAVATLIAEATAEVTAGPTAGVEVEAILRAGAVMLLHTARAEGTKAGTTVCPALSGLV